MRAEFADLLFFGIVCLLVILALRAAF